MSALRLASLAQEPQRIISIDLTHLVEAALRGDVASTPPPSEADEDVERS